MDIKESGRSSDFSSPSFIYECGFNCTYCYVKRHKGEYITIAKNNGDLLSAVNDHVAWLPEKEPNQTHPKYYTYDIGCNSDIGLHHKQINWRYIFDFFKNHPRIMGTFATKLLQIRVKMTSKRNKFCQNLTKIQLENFKKKLYL